MKNLLSILSALLAASACADPGAVVVAGRSLPCHFENQSLSEESKAAIAADLAVVWGNWPDSTVEVGQENGFAGKLSNPNVWQSPYLSGKDVPEWLVAEGTNLALHVPASISSEYEAAFAFSATMTNEFAALSLFVSAFSPTALSNATPAELSAVLHGQGPVNSDNRDQIVSELLETRFDTPSILGVGFSSKRIGSFPAGTLVAGIPCHAAAGPKPFYAVWPAAWIDGVWKLLPLY